MPCKLSFNFCKFNPCSTSAGNVFGTYDCRLRNFRLARLWKTPLSNFQVTSVCKLNVCSSFNPDRAPLYIFDTFDFPFVF